MGDPGLQSGAPQIYLNGGVMVSGFLVCALQTTSAGTQWWRIPLNVSQAQRVEVYPGLAQPCRPRFRSARRLSRKIAIARRAKSKHCGSSMPRGGAGDALQHQVPTCHVRVSSACPPHTPVKRFPPGPRDNGEYEWRCSICDIFLG